MCNNAALDLKKNLERGCLKRQSRSLVKLKIKATIEANPNLTLGEIADLIP